MSDLITDQLKSHDFQDIVADALNDPVKMHLMASLCIKVNKNSIGKLDIETIQKACPLI